MAEKQCFSSGTFWENEVGYSRAVKAGNIIEVAGTTSVDGDSIIGKGDIIRRQFLFLKKLKKYCLKLIVV